MVDIMSAISATISEVIAALPRIIGALIIIIIGYYVGKAIGSGVNRVIEKTGLERVVDNTEVGKSYRRAGIDFSTLIGNLVWAFIAVFALAIGLQFLGLTGTVGEALVNVAMYIVRVVGAVLILVFGAALFELLATLIARQLGIAIPPQKSELADLLKYILFVGFLAVLLRIAFGILLLPGEAVYPFMLGVIAMALGITFSEKLVGSLAAEHEDFRPIAGYAKFLVLLVFFIIGVAGLFGTVPGTITVIEKLAWGIAIAAAIMLIPVIYYLAKKLVTV